jgi:hypothetical protein
MWNVKQGLEDSYPLILFGAPVQGYSSPLVLARTKCSLQDVFSLLRHGESLMTMYNSKPGYQQVLVVITEIESPPSYLGDADHQE